MKSGLVLVRRHSVTIFFALACAPIWTIVSLGLSARLGVMLSALAPATAAVLLIALADGQAGWAELWRRALAWRQPPAWIAAAILLPAACVLLPIVVADLMVPEAYSAAPITAANRAVLGGVFLFAFLEELGWTGYAMPRILRHSTALSAALVIGFVQGIYHLPVLLLGASPLSIASGVLIAMAFRVLMTWIYLPTGGSVVIAALFHGSLNAVSSLVLAGVNPASFNLVYSSGFVPAAVVVIAATGRDLRRRAPPSAAS